MAVSLSSDLHKPILFTTHIFFVFLEDSRPNTDGQITIKLEHEEPMIIEERPQKQYDQKPSHYTSEIKSDVCPGLPLASHLFSFITWLRPWRFNSAMIDERMSLCQLFGE